MRLLKYSGLLAMFFAWVFVVFPTLFAGIDSKKQTITFATNNKKVKIIINLGLIIGGFFQLVFSYFILHKYSLNYFNIGVLLYTSTAITSISVAIFSEQSYPKIHKYLAEYYFLVNPLSLMIIGLSVNHYILKTISLFIPITYYIGLFYLHSKHKTKNALMEKWAFVTMSIWTFTVTFI
jgi:hypothetical membrane protein